MDLDFRASSTIHSANHLSSVQAARIHSEKESDSQNGQPETRSTLCNADKLELELAYQAYVMGLNENWSHSNDIRDGVDGKPEADGPNSGEENYSVFNYTDEDDDAHSVFRCPFCDFEIEVSVLRSRLEEVHSYYPKNVVCPVCDEKLGEDAMGHTQHSSSRKRTWRSEKSSIWAGNSAMFGKKLATWGNKHEPMPDPLLSPFICNLSNEDSINNASDISNAKSSGTDAPDMGDEQDHQERRLRASFVQQLVFSTIF